MTLLRPARRIVYVLAIAVGKESFELMGIFQTPGAAARSLGMELDSFQFYPCDTVSHRWYLETGATSYWIFQGPVDHALEVALQKPYQSPKPPWNNRWGPPPGSLEDPPEPA